MPIAPERHGLLIPKKCRSETGGGAIFSKYALTLSPDVHTAKTLQICRSSLLSYSVRAHIRRTCITWSTTCAPDNVYAWQICLDCPSHSFTGIAWNFRWPNLTFMFTTYSKITKTYSPYCHINSNSFPISVSQTSLVCNANYSLLESEFFTFLSSLYRCLLLASEQKTL